MGLYSYADLLFGEAEFIAAAVDRVNRSWETSLTKALAQLANEHLYRERCLVRATIDLVAVNVINKVGAKRYAPAKNAGKNANLGWGSMKLPARPCYKRALGAGNNTNSISVQSFTVGAFGELHSDATSQASHPRTIISARRAGMCAA